MFIKSILRTSLLNLPLTYVRDWSILAIWVFLFLVPLVFLLSCKGNNNTGGLSILPNNDGFTNGNPSSSGEDENAIFQIVKKRKLDIIWVMDNSPSMNPHHIKIRDHFESFIKAFQNRNYDFKIAITTTDAYKEFPNPPDEPFVASRKDSLILTSNTPNLKNRFMENVDLISNEAFRGSSDERGMDSLIKVLESKKGKAFLRPDAFLSVIIVSDEEDSSINVNIKKGTSSFRERKPELYVSHFMSKLTEIKNGNKENFSIAAIVTNNDQCAQELSAGELGILYVEIAKATSGAIGSLCNNDFDELMESSAQAVIVQTNYYKLKREPDIELAFRVFVNGEEKIEERDWFYHQKRQAVYFHFDTLPSSGDSINIQYFPLWVEGIAPDL